MILLVLLYRLRVRQLSSRVQAEERSRLSARIEERERIARDLHDTLLQSTQGLILLFHAYAGRLPSADRLRQEIEGGLRMADQLLKEARASVGDLRTTGLSVSVSDALTKAGEELLAGKPIAFRVASNGTPRPLLAPVADDVYRIGREAILNAAQHSNGRSIELTFEFKDDAFRVSVCDDGRGIDAELSQGGSLPNHFGLQGMRERAQRIGAKLVFGNRKPSGAEVQLIVPAQLAYQNPQTLGA